MSVVSMSMNARTRKLQGALCAYLLVSFSIAGTVASFAFGAILDKTKMFKEVSVFLPYQE